MDVPGGLAVLDREALYEQAGGDPSLVAELVALFKADASTLLPAIRDALADRDAVTVAKGAHRLKGSLGALGAHAAHAVIRELETAARCADLARAAAMWAQVEEEFARLDPELSRAGG